MGRPPAILEAFEGLGDTIYLRPSIRALAERYDLHVATPWPELLKDLDVRFVRIDAQYRTQAENVGHQDDERFVPRPADATRLKPRVQWQSRLSIPAGIADSLGLDWRAMTFDLAGDRPPLLAHFTAEPYAVVRPVTLRREWLNPRRNPDPRYVAAAAARLQDAGLRVISVAHLQEGEEWALDPIPPADVQLHHGELGVRELLGLIRGAKVVVGGVGFIVPACPALDTPLVIIAGGQGYYNRPAKVTGPPMDTSRVRWLIPDEYCTSCASQDHDCPKEVSGFEEKLEAALNELEVL